MCLLAQLLTVVYTAGIGRQWWYTSYGNCWPALFLRRLTVRDKRVRVVRECTHGRSLRCRNLLIEVRTLSSTGFRRRVRSTAHTSAPFSSRGAHWWSATGTLRRCCRTWNSYDGRCSKVSRWWSSQRQVSRRMFFIVFAALLWRQLLYMSNTVCRGYNWSVSSHALFLQLLCVDLQ